VRHLLCSLPSVTYNCVKQHWTTRLAAPTKHLARAQRPTLLRASHQAKKLKADSSWKNCNGRFATFHLLPS
jgi:hypothetical protein